MTSLASLLTRDSVVPVEIIERALERQTLEGGELDTALLELEACSENLLAAYRAASFRAEPAARGEMLRIEPAVIDCISPKLARRFHVVPISMQDGNLVIAAVAPLNDDTRAQLETASASAISVRIAIEVRIASALDRHYGLSMGERMRKLSAALDARSPGALVHVDPDVPSKRLTRPPPAVVSLAPQASGEPDAYRSELLRGRTLPMQPAPGPPSDSPVQVTRVVELAPRKELDEAPSDTRPLRPSKLPPPAPRSEQPPSTAPAPLETPLTRDLAAATDRAQVEHALLAHAQHRFACVVLFEVRDKHLLGRAARGLPRGIEVDAIESAMSRPLQSVVLAGQSRVLDLRRDCPGDPLPSLLDRMAAQPCAVMPVSLGKRVVITLYADNDGRPMSLDAIADFTNALPVAGQALERILQDRKSGALEARRSQLPPTLSSRPRAPVHPYAPTDPGFSPPGSYGHTDPGLFDSTSATSGSSYVGREIDEDLSEAALRSLPASKSSAPGPIEGYEAHVDTPTMVLKREEAEPARDRDDTTNPERPSSMPPRDHVARKLTNPPKPAGSYALRNLDEPVAEPARPSHAPRPHEPARAYEAPRDRAFGHDGEATRSERKSVHPRPLPTDVRRDREDARREPDPRETVKDRGKLRDPRRDDDQGRQPPTRADVVSMSRTMRESLRPPALSDSDGALNIDLSGEADRLVERLSASTPGEEAPLIAAIVRLGVSGIAAIVRRFPGPSWAPRGQLHKRTTAGRDLGPLPRALWAFDEQMVPAVTELLEAPHADARLYATVLAGDRVHPDLLWPLYRRLFDSEGSVRLLVSETLPLYRNMPGFDDVVKSLRKRTGDERESVQNRLAALEAVASLRDPGSIEALADLAAHHDRQFSVPAQRALVAITGQDFDDASKKWKSWYQKHAGLHRAQWLIDSLMHGDERVRAVAAQELQKLTQVYYGFVASAPKRDRERAQDRYRAWWEAEGKAQFVRQPT